MSDLERLASTAEFQKANQPRRAEMIVWLIEGSGEEQGASVADVSSSFEKLRLSRPNATRLREHFRKSRNMRSVGTGRYGVVRDFALAMQRVLPPEIYVADDVLDIAQIELPPFVTSDRKDDLKRMVHAYARLFLLENSMRGLIE